MEKTLAPVATAPVLNHLDDIAVIPVEARADLDRRAQAFAGVPSRLLREARYVG